LVVELQLNGTWASLGFWSAGFVRVGIHSGQDGVVQKQEPVPCRWQSEHAYPPLWYGLTKYA